MNGISSLLKCPAIHPAIVQLNQISTISRALLYGTVAITSERIVNFLKRQGLPTVPAYIMTAGLATSILLYLGAEAFYLSQYKSICEQNWNRPGFNFTLEGKNVPGLRRFFATFNHLSIIGKVVLCSSLAMTSERIVAFLTHRFTSNATVFPAYCVTAFLAYTVLSDLEAWANHHISYKTLAENNASLFTTPLPSEKPRIKSFIEDQVSVRREAYETWNAARSQYESSHPYTTFPTQPTTWCIDPTIQAQDADWGMTTLSAQAQHEIVPGLWLAGNYQPNAFYGTGGMPHQPTYMGIIAATNRLTDYVTSLKRSMGTFFQITDAPNAQDVGVESFSANKCVELSLIVHAIAFRLSNNQNVLVFCQQGADRSATVVIAYLMSAYQLSFEDALLYVRSRRFIANPQTEYQDFLKTTWQDCLTQASNEKIAKRKSQKN